MAPPGVSNPNPNPNPNAAFGGWHGVHRHQVGLNVADHVEVDTMYTHLSVMNRLCNIFLRRDFVAVLNLVNKQGELNDAQASVLAARISKLGRSQTHDNGICKVIVETSVPKLGDAIAGLEGSICRKVHVLPMSLEDFKACFAEFALADEEARNVLPKQETAPPKASWFGPTDKDREAYTAWASKLLSCKLEGGGPGITTVEDLATEYFYKVGPNVRRLADLVGEKEVDGTFAEGMCCFGVYVLSQPGATLLAPQWGVQVRRWEEIAEVAADTACVCAVPPTDSDEARAASLAMLPSHACVTWVTERRLSTCAGSELQKLIMGVPGGVAVLKAWLHGGATPATTVAPPTAADAARPCAHSTRVFLAAKVRQCKDPAKTHKETTQRLRSWCRAVDPRAELARVELVSDGSVARASCSFPPEKQAAAIAASGRDGVFARPPMEDDAFDVVWLDGNPEEPAVADDAMKVTRRADVAGLTHGCVEGWVEG